MMKIRLTAFNLRSISTLLTVLFSVLSAHAIEVTSTNDLGAGSLRQAIIDASPDDTITFTNTLDGTTILLTSGQIILDKNLTINASMLPEGLTISGNGSSRIFQVNSGTTNALLTLTLTGGYGSGGAIYNNGDLLISRSTIHGNTGAFGGGAIYSEGSSSRLTMNQCTVTGNTAVFGGAFLFRNSSSVTLVHCTLYANTGTGGTGGIVLESGAALTLRNTILAGNQSPDAANISDLGGQGGTVTLTGHNLIGAQSSAYSAVMPAGTPNINGDYVGTSASPLDPLLSPLFDFGGPTQTMPPLTVSPAIDTGDTTSTNSLTDQRGFDRVVGTDVDIGATESGNPIPAFYVDTPLDEDDGLAANNVSLRDAIAYAPAGSTIVFAPALSGQTLLLTHGQLLIDRNLNIDASALPGGIIIDGNSNERIFEITATSTLDSLTLTNGFASGSFPASHGGAIFVNGGNLTLNNSALSGNTASGYGGGIYSYNVFESTLNNCTLSNNIANQGGGSCNSTLNNCTLTDNTAYDFGGGSYQGTLNNCKLTGNQAGQDGGGSYQGTLKNCLLINNSANSGGGSHSGSLYNCTVTGNSADNGGGVNDVWLYNCMVYFNTASYSGDNYFNTICNYSCTTPHPGGQGNITTAPMFAATNDFHLVSGSPGINAGNNSYVDSLTDLDGNPRSVGGTVDMGAFESPAVVVTVNANNGTGTGSGIYFPGESTPISARGTTVHYSLTSWNDGNTNRIRTITVPSTNSTYTASFTENIFNPITTYVAVSNATPVWPYATWATAATNIQDAVDATGNGYDDTVIVSNGVYATGGRVVYGELKNRVVIEKDIKVQSLNGPDVTIIEGAGPLGDSAVRCVYIGGYGATLSGFTLTNGATRYFGDYEKECSGGGVWSFNTAVITNCIFTDNAAAYYGGGAYKAQLYHCVLTGNQANEYGGGAYGGTLNNCLLTDNYASYGGGMAAATLNNCTVTGNSAQIRGGGSNGGWVNNSIIYFNTASSDPNHDYGNFNYSCTTPLPTGGSGNTDLPPMFTATNDFHLLPGSPCIDEGDFYYGTELDIPKDLDGAPRIVGDVVDMGAYESPYVGIRVANADGTTTGSGNFLPGEDVLISATSTNAHSFFSDWSDGNTNPSRTVTVSTTKTFYTANYTQYVGSVTGYVSQANPNPVWPYISWETAATNMHDAIDALLDGDLVVVSNGIYATGGRAVPGRSLVNRLRVDKALTVQSLNGPEVTIIEGAGPRGPTAVRCVYLGPDAILSGFTLTNGATRTTGSPYFEELGAGGVYCTTSAIVTNCVITRNWSASGGGSVGGTLNRCTFSYNSADQWGGGARGSTLNHCILLNNIAELQGGGAFQGTLNHCTLMGNEAFEQGGGAISAELNYCILTQNSAGYLGGGADSSTLNNCVLSGNWMTVSDGDGGGGSECTLNNCTITGNRAGENGGFGGGVFSSTLTNCIVYFNEANNSSSGTYVNHFSSSFSYSCTTPLPGGSGNIAGNPQFANPNIDLRLRPGSPGIDAGNNASVVGIIDLNGGPRIVNSTADMGAFENNGGYATWAAAITNGLTGYSDNATGDGYPNLLKYATGSSATNSDNLARMDIAAINGMVQVLFNHNPDALDITVYVKASDTLANGAPWTAIATNQFGSWGAGANIIENGGTPATVILEESTSSSSNRFYRLEVEPVP